MERERWSTLMRAIHDVNRSWRDTAYHSHSTAMIVRVYLWAVLHDRPVHWACEPGHWDDRKRPDKLPSQSAMSRRLRTEATRCFMDKLAQRLDTVNTGRSSLLKWVDGKPLPVSANSIDRDATWGWGAS